MLDEAGGAGTGAVDDSGEDALAHSRVEQAGAEDARVDLEGCGAAGARGDGLLVGKVEVRVTGRAASPAVIQW
ncbi:hypothetical protein BG452_13510 [Streptomyces sp. CBMA123]|nr:hypothetical protein [Streptomyces sp. CBMA123]